MRVRVRLTFPEALVTEPVIARLVRRFDVEPSIRKASIDDHSAWMTCQLSGQPPEIEAALAWLDGQGIEVEPLSDVVES